MMSAIRIRLVVFGPTPWRLDMSRYCTSFLARMSDKHLKQARSAMGGDEDWTYPRATTIVTDIFGRAFRDGLIEGMGYADAARHAHEVVQKLVADWIERGPLRKSRQSRPTPAAEERSVAHTQRDRRTPALQFVGRTTLENIDEIGGIRLERGQSVVCLLCSANRDPTVYLNPDQLDITRPDVRPLSFGGGIHYCVAAQPTHYGGEREQQTPLQPTAALPIHAHG